jgi:hypothetical protein
LKNQDPYIIISETELVTLKEEVNEKILEGYEPIGNITYGNESSYPKYYQAMFKKSKQKR